MVRQSELQCGSYGRRKWVVNNDHHHLHATLSQLSFFPSFFSFEEGDGMKRNNGAWPLLSTHNGSFVIMRRGPLRAIIFKIGVRVRVLNIFVIVLILLFSLRSIPDG
ncbi:hypothetical protein PIB30_072857, partial [Stylosanthes scabra]|nr:hypothetical protein [Stylosanthes scabra]